MGCIFTIKPFQTRQVPNVRAIPSWPYLVALVGCLLQDFDFAESTRAKLILKGSFACPTVISQACLRFSHPENLSTPARFEPATVSLWSGHVTSEPPSPHA
ncbi:hypothetical protein TNCV_554671 [Trichonephila clavipes]|nr:hypothetical protein TNCV_554671 [Trichonephila clavipes]